MVPRTLFTRSLLRRTHPTTFSATARLYATDVDPPPLRENHGSSSHPRDSLRFADDPPSSAEPSSSSSPAPPSPSGSSTTPLTPPYETPLPPTSSSFELITPSPEFEPLFPPLSPHDSTVARVPFSTHRFVRRLEENQVPRELATELMKATRALLQREEEQARGVLLGRSDLENVRPAPRIRLGVRDGENGVR